MNQLAQKKTLAGMLVAALMCVALLAVAAPQEAYATQGWNNNSKGFWYEYNDKGLYYKNGWQKIDSFWYYFQKNGYAKTGWLKSGKYWYYLQDNSTYAAPFMVFSTTTTINGKDYYFDSSGRMATGWAKAWDDGDYSYDSAVAWVYANKSGQLTKGWKKISGKWYYFGFPGYDKYFYSTNGWKTINGKDYYFNKSTAMVTGWQKIDGNWFYFNKSGAMQTNKWIGNYWLGADGAMATDSWVDNGKYYVDKNGKWVKGKTK